VWGMKTPMRRALVVAMVGFRGMIVSILRLSEDCGVSKGDSNKVWKCCDLYTLLFRIWRFVGCTGIEELSLWITSDPEFQEDSF
jgi:hypothetical protein